MNWWVEKAGFLQSKVAVDEEQAAHRYDDEKVKRSVVHAREDIVLLVSYLSSANRQLAGIKSRLSWILVGIFGIIFLIIKYHYQ